MSNPEWSELETIAARFPRYSRAYGMCPSCGLGATLLQAVPPIWWATCQLCTTRWPSAVQGLTTALDPHDTPNVDVEPEIDDAIRGEFAYAAMLDLARCHELLPLTNEGDRMMKATTKTEPGIGFEAWAAELALGAKCDNDPSSPAPPSAWPHFSPETRPRLSLVLTEPDPDRLGYWRLLCARSMHAVDMAENPAVTEKLKAYFVEDFEERAKWQRAAAEIAAPAVGVLFLDLAARKLRSAGGLLATLRKQRAAIDSEIARLEQRAAVAV